MENKVSINEVMSMYRREYENGTYTLEDIFLGGMKFAQQNKDSEESDKDIERTILGAINAVTDVREMLKHYDMEAIARAINRMTTAGALSAQQALIISSMLR